MMGFVLIGYSTDFNWHYANAMCAEVYSLTQDLHVSMKQDVITGEFLQVIWADPYLMLNMGNSL